MGNLSSILLDMAPPEVTKAASASDFSTVIYTLLVPVVTAIIACAIVFIVNAYKKNRINNKAESGTDNQEK